MPKPGPREIRGVVNGRALLFLSLILLIWNAGASGRRLFSLVPNLSPRAAGAPDTVRQTSANFPASTGAESPRQAPLSIRQKYLLGKRIDINKATLSEISELPGISDRIAAAVVEERARKGRFRAPEDLLGVKGIKEKRLQKILPFLEEIQNN